MRPWQILISQAGAKCRMKQIEPQVFLVAATMVKDGMKEYLKYIGDPEWITDARTDPDLLAEAAGRMCYRSWQPYDPAKPDCTNPNVERVREGNFPYIANIVKSGHGSILEHVNFTFVFAHVSRVFTHELVRHRAGMGYSQESLRYVRLEDLRIWMPEAVKSGGQEAINTFMETVGLLEQTQMKLARMFGISEMKDFSLKKKLTSMFRRLAPIGLATTIMATGNARAWRHIVNMRCSEAAEEEMQFVIGRVCPILKAEAPALFQDLYQNDKGEWTFGLHVKP